MRSLAHVFVATLLASVAAAHPGHGESGQAFSIAHYLSEPIHAAGALGVACLLIGTLQLARRRRRSPSRLES